MRRFIVIYNSNGGMAELYNVGFFDAETPAEAKKRAQEQWNTTADLYVVNADGLYDGWSFYT